MAASSMHYPTNITATNLLLDRKQLRYFS